MLNPCGRVGKGTGEEHKHTWTHRCITSHMSVPLPQALRWQQTPPPPSDALLAPGYKPHGAVGAWLRLTLSMSTAPRSRFSLCLPCWAQEAFWQGECRKANPIHTESWGLWQPLTVAQGGDPACKQSFSDGAGEPGRPGADHAECQAPPQVGNSSD